MKGNITRSITKMEKEIDKNATTENEFFVLPNQAGKKFKLRNFLLF